MKKLLLSAMLFGVSLLPAKTFTLTLHEPSILSGTELKPGNYKAELTEDKLVVSGGKKTVEADVKVKNEEKKFNATTVRYQNGDGKYRVRQILVGGTNLRVIVSN
jgi:hypothetical protein